MNKGPGRDVWLNKFEFIVEISLQERGKCYTSMELSGKEGGSFYSLGMKAVVWALRWQVAWWISEV